MKSFPDGLRILRIWDTEGDPPVDAQVITLLWRDYAKKDLPGTISIPELVEEQADRLRARYLAWIHDLGYLWINGKTVIDHLELRPGFSYWWMTSLAQKFNFSGTSQIDNAIKAFVFEKLAEDFNPSKIELVSGNEKLAGMVKLFCREKGISFKKKPVRMHSPEATEASSIRKLFNALPPPIKAFISFIRYLAGGMFLVRKKHFPPHCRGEVSFIDALVHLDDQAFKQGRFISNYWTSLPDLLTKHGLKTNWLHNFFPQGRIPTRRHAHWLTERFNITSRGEQFHALMETGLSGDAVLSMMSDYVKIYRTGIRLSAMREHLRPVGSSLDFWPLFGDEWIDSLRGQSAFINCLRLSLYEKIFHEMPAQKRGFYLQENQPWETALIHAWKAAGHGILIGVPHTSIRFWDLRYFYDPRTYEPSGKNHLPMPDLVAVNGPAAKKSYIQGGYPPSLITEAEALRFLHLLNSKPQKQKSRSSTGALNVLICGEFLPSANRKMLSWLSIGAASLPPETSYIFKPHPAYPVDPTDFVSLDIEITQDPLVDIFPRCDVVVTGNMTSAGVDAYSCGLPVIQVVDGASLNMTPLRGLRHVVNVTSPAELKSALLESQYREQMVMLEEPLFFLDKELPRWRQLLNVDGFQNCG